MTTFKTGNAIGSTAVKDLYDNAENLDYATNDKAARQWTDRLGVERKTWYGMEQDFQDFLVRSGYDPIGDYAAGLEITARNQVFRKDGEMYRVSAALELPYTTTGDWATEGSLFVAVGDAVLRQQLSDGSTPGLGAGMVGYGASTVDQAVTSIEASQVDLQQDVVTAQADIADLQEDRLIQFGINSKSYNSVNGALISQNPWGVRCLNVLGDSISFGANANDIERDSYVGILKKMLNVEFGQANIGLLNIISGSSNEHGSYGQYFSASSSQTGTWTSISGPGASHIPFGFALQSNVVGSTQNLKCPLSQRYMRVWYDGTVSGSIEVVIDSVVVQTITTDGMGTGGDRATTAIELGLAVTANKGVCNFTLRCKSGTIRLTGLEFTNDLSGNSFRVHNFSRDGRAGRYVGQEVINQACAGAYAFIWALGTNDVPGLDEVALAEYTQRIDWIISAAAANRTRVVFVDFLFDQPYSHPLRQQIRRGAATVRGSVLIEADRVWTVSGAQYSDAERTSRGLAAGVHPEEIGHRLIAESIAKSLGLQVTSKREAILRDPMWKALDMSASTLVNSSTIPGRISGYRIGERFVEVVVNITTVPTTTTLLGTIPAADSPGLAGLNIPSNPDPTGKHGLFTIASDGGIYYRPDPTSSPPAAVSLYAAIPYHNGFSWF